MLPELAVRRFLPEPGRDGVGPMPWHPPVPYDAERDRLSACDDERAPRASDPSSDGPYHQLDSESARLIRVVADFLRRPRARLVPYMAPPDGLPEAPRGDDVVDVAVGASGSMGHSGIRAAGY